MTCMPPTTTCRPSPAARPPLPPSSPAACLAGLQTWRNCVEKHGQKHCVRQYNPQQLVKGMYSEFILVGVYLSWGRGPKGMHARGTLRSCFKQLLAWWAYCDEVQYGVVGAALGACPGGAGGLAPPCRWQAGAVPSKNACHLPTRPPHTPPPPHPLDRFTSICLSSPLPPSPTPTHPPPPKGLDGPLAPRPAALPAQ